MRDLLPRRPRVLLVDDDVGSASLAQSLFDHGLTVETAVSAADARICLGARSYDAVVTSLDLADDGGANVLRIAHEYDPVLPVLLVTGAPTLQSALDAIEEDAAGYLVRPVTPLAAFHAICSAVLRREHAGASVQRLSVAAPDKDLRAALDRAIEQLYMVFQPIVSWSDRSIVAYEALVRTREPTLARPDLLFAAAEKFGKVIEMGRVIRAAVARQLAAAPSEINVFVNVHGAELADEELYSPEAPLSELAERVVLEITERWSLDGFADVRERIRALRGIGFRVAVDDLGAGYAGLTSFARLRPEIVKIDMSLVRGVHQDATRQQLIRSLNRLCRDLDIRVVAEGIETVEERDALVALGSDLFQGYLFSKPAADFPGVDWEDSVTRISLRPSVAASGSAALGELRDALSRLLDGLDRADTTTLEWQRRARELAQLGRRLIDDLDRDSGEHERLGDGLGWRRVRAAAG